MTQLVPESEEFFLFRFYAGSLQRSLGAKTSDEWSVFCQALQADVLSKFKKDDVLAMTEDPRVLVYHLNITPKMMSNVPPLMLLNKMVIFYLGFRIVEIRKSQITKSNFLG